jgi:two-component system nitrate/nitrite response regulator NarL
LPLTTTPDYVFRNLTILIGIHGTLVAMKPIQLLIVADDILASAGLAMRLGELPGCVITGQLSSSELALEWHPLSYPVPDAILWDVGWEMPDPVPEWVEEMSVPIVALMGDEMHIAEVWNAGIQALLRRDTGPEKLMEALRVVCQGFIVFDPELALALMPATASAEFTPVEDLTPRESEVLQLLAEGLTNKAIAQRLAISDHTVKFHVNAILSKLGAQSRTEAVVQATRAGLISL